MSSTWNATELDTIGDAEEIELSSRRPDGALSPAVTIWVVREGRDLYVRAASGKTANWFRRAGQSHAGHIRAGGIDRDVRFAEPDSGIDARLDAIYHQKYDRYGPSIVGPMVAPEAAAATLRLVPR